jgi:hypothetical protein
MSFQGEGQACTLGLDEARVSCCHDRLFATTTVQFLKLFNYQFFEREKKVTFKNYSKNFLIGGISNENI